MSAAPDPAVSVIVPMYNRPEYIGAALASIRRQSMADFEVICVDAGSSEPVPELVASLIADDTRFRLIVSGMRLSGPEARNVALEQARAPVVASLDSDDVMVPGRLDLHLTTLAAEPRTVALGGGLRVVNRDGLPCTRPAPTVSGHEGSDELEQRPEWAQAPRTVADTAPKFSWMLPFNCPTLSSTMTVRTEALRASGGFDLVYPDCDDYGTFWRLESQGDSRVLPELAAIYRRHSQQISTDGRRRQSIQVVLLRREIMSARLGRLVDVMSVAAATGESVTKPGAYDDGEALCHELLEKFLAENHPSAAERQWIETDFAHRISVIARARTRQAEPATTPLPSR